MDKIIKQNERIGLIDKRIFSEIVKHQYTLRIIKSNLRIEDKIRLTCFKYKDEGIKSAFKNFAIVMCFGIRRKSIL